MIHQTTSPAIAAIDRQAPGQAGVTRFPTSTHWRPVVTIDSIDLTLWLAGAALELFLLSVLLYKRIYRSLPIFCIFLVWCLLSDVGMAIALRLPNAYLPATLISLTGDALFQLAILAELGRAVLRHNHVAPPSRVVLMLLGLLACVIAGILNNWTVPLEYPFLSMLYLVLLQLFAALRVVFLLTLVWWTSVQKLRWPTRELQILTGLGVYIMVTLCVVILHTHNMATMQYHWLDQLLVASYLFALCFWILASTTNVAERE
jgi:hypothetical protein